MALHEVQQDAHHRQAHDEADHEADRDDGDEVGGQLIAALHRVQREGAGHGGDGEEEAELRRRPLADAQQQAADDGGAAARHAGHQGEALEEAHAQGRPEAEAHGVVTPGLRRPAFERDQGETADDQGHADDRRVEQHLFDVVVQQEAERGGGQEGQEHGEGETAGGRIGRQADEHLPQPGEIQGDDRQDRPELDHDREGLPAVGGGAQEFAGEEEVARGGDRDELGQPLDQAQDDGDQPVAHAEYGTPVG